MSGMHTYLEEARPFSKAELAGLDTETVNRAAKELARHSTLSYDEAEDEVIRVMVNSLPRPVFTGWDFNNDANKRQASMREAGGEGTGRYVQKRHKKTKSSKRIAGTNFTPPKKKRKK